MSFNFSTVDKIGDLPEDIREHLPRIIQNRIKEYEQMQPSFDSNDYDAICKYCHKVEGIAVSYGLHELDEIIRYIHQLARECDSQHIHEVLPDLASYFAKIRSYI